jgi:hypothetical protein
MARARFLVLADSINRVEQLYWRLLPPEDFRQQRNLVGGGPSNWNRCGRVTRVL